jgi:hypothetical protein
MTASFVGYANKVANKVLRFFRIQGHLIHFVRLNKVSNAIGADEKLVPFVKVEGVDIWVKIRLLTDTTC